MRVEQKMKNRSGDKKEEEGGGEASTIEGFGIDRVEWDNGDLAGQQKTVLNGMKASTGLSRNDVDEGNGVEQKTVSREKTASTVLSRMKASTGLSRKRWLWGYGLSDEGVDALGFPYLNALISGHDFTVLIGLVIC
ncbi:uncharacterized protein G2W53_017983 [Senna tora]|uniref:Uncharacterized protein n=1 Tax=Senna tora TaxID=362788 RepID=A0A834WRC7_9FABA|nr:uncharacterized protein G2W53_017983 [Senna tora]